MGLPMRDRRALARIEEYFLADDPDLALLLSTFGGGPRRRRRPVPAVRRRAGAAIAYVAVALGAALLVAACLARSAVLLWAAGGMVFLSVAPFLAARLRAPGRRAPDARRHGAQP
ncbi:DUF3040 domain-containing protein [Streptomyces lunalinharesii]|uniref:DUF3040 domain-containing protein n=1 Tax=Streptomyces lunalinharesii TaxID=333384 RepID=A0ABN3SAI9_9ACTN